MKQTQITRILNLLHLLVLDCNQLKLTTLLLIAPSHNERIDVENAIGRHNAQQCLRKQLHYVGNSSFAVPNAILQDDGSEYQMNSLIDSGSSINLIMSSSIPEAHRGMIVDVNEHHGFTGLNKSQLKIKGNNQIVM